MPPARSLRHGLLLIALAGGPLAARLAVAQGPAAAARAAVVLVVEETTPEIDERSLRQSIAAELRGPVLGASEAGAREARGVLSVRVQKMDVAMSFRPRSGSPVERRIPLPEGRAERLAAISLLAGNLARDESAALLASLRPPASATPGGSSPVADLSAPPAASSAPPAASTAGAVPAGSASAASAPASASASAPAEGSAAPASPGTPPPGSEPEPSGEGYCSVPGGAAQPVAVAVVSPVGLPYGAEPGLTNLAFALFYGQIGGLEGAQLGTGVVSSRGNASGVQLGVGGWVGGRARGLFIGGVFHHIRCDTRGMQVSSFVASQSGHLTGLQASGLVSLAQGSVHGGQVASTAAITRGEVHGLQWAGFHTQAGSIHGSQASVFSMTEALHGVQLGVLSLAGEATGVQGGVVNLSGPLQGAQLGVVNVAGPVSGFQLGLVNIGGEMSGPQIGLVNVAGRQEGYSFGLLSVARNTVIQGEVWGSRTVEGAIGVRVLTGLAYSSFTLVYDNSNGLDRLGVGVALGLHLPLGSGFFTDIDYGYYALPVVGRRQGKDDDRRADHYEGDQKLRLMLNYELGKHLSVFAGPGLTARYREDSPDFHVLFDASVGAVF